MNKVLITGLGIGKSMDICESCNLDYSWLIGNPATFIWADKICIPSDLFGHTGDNDKFDKAVKLIMEIADSLGLVDKITISDSSKKDAEKIYLSAIEDAKLITTCFPESAKKGNERVPDEIIVNGISFCGPIMASIYASLKIADEIGANCLFNERVNEFLKYKYGLDMNKHTHENERKIYNEIFQTLIPNKPILHEYAIYDDTRCESCARFASCKDNYLRETEEHLKEVLKWRDYDEIYQAKEVINDLIWRKNGIKTDEEVREVVAEFAEKRRKINRNIKKRFPAIQRWTNLVTVLATPVTIYSGFNNIPTVTAISGGVSGLSALVSNSIELYKSKNNWVGFFDKTIN